MGPSQRSRRAGYPAGRADSLRQQPGRGRGAAQVPEQPACALAIAERRQCPGGPGGGRAPRIFPRPVLRGLDSETPGAGEKSPKRSAHKAGESGPRERPCRPGGGRVDSRGRVRGTPNQPRGRPEQRPHPVCRDARGDRVAQVVAAAPPGARRSRPSSAMADWASRRRAGPRRQRPPAPSRPHLPAARDRRPGCRRRGSGPPRPARASLGSPKPGGPEPCTRRPRRRSPRRRRRGARRRPSRREFQPPPLRCDGR